MIVWRRETPGSSSTILHDGSRPISTIGVLSASKTCPARRPDSKINRYIGLSRTLYGSARTVSTQPFVRLVLKDQTTSKCVGSLGLRSHLVSHAGWIVTSTFTSSHTACSLVRNSASDNCGGTPTRMFSANIAAPVNGALVACVSSDSMLAPH